MGNEDLKNAAAAWILWRKGDARNGIEGKLEAAALRVWPQAQGYAKRELRGSHLPDDESLIWDVWESSLESAQRSLRARSRLRPVQNLEAYILGIFCHRMKKRLAKERRIEFVPSNSELEELGATQDWSWPANLNDRIFLRKAISDMDDWMKEALFQRAIEGTSWEEVGHESGLSEQVAKKRFLYRLKKIRERLFQTEKNGTVRW